MKNNTTHGMLARMATAGVLSLSLSVPSISYADEASQAPRQASASSEVPDDAVNCDTDGDGKSDVNTREGEGKCYDDEDATVSDSVKDKVRSVNGIKFKGVTKTRVLSWVESTGMPKWQIQSAKQSGNVYTAPRAMTLWTSYIALDGTEKWHPKRYAAGHKFYLGPDGWFHDAPCNNKVKVPPTKKKVPGSQKLRGHYKIVKVFKFWGYAKAKVEGAASATAMSWDNGYLVHEDGTYVLDENGQPIRKCRAYADAQGRASFFARAKAKLKGRIYASASAAVSAMVQNAQGKLSGKIEGEVNGDVKGYVRALARGDAFVNLKTHAQCEDTVQPNQPEQPPTGEIVQAPKHLYLANPNDPESKNGESRMKFVGSDPEDGGNVTFTITTSDNVELLNDAEHPIHDDVEGSSRVRYQWIRAKSAGEASVTLVVTDQKGNTFSQTVTFQVYADEF